MQQRQIIGGAPRVLITLEHRRGQIKLAEDVAQARRQPLASLERSAEHKHRRVGKQRKARGKTRELAVIAPRVRITRDADKARARQPQHQHPHQIAHDKRCMAEECDIEITQGARRIRLLCGTDFLEHPRMAADRTLPEDDHRTRQYVRTFHRDADRNLLIGAGQIITGPHTNTLATMHVHRIVDDSARTLGQMIFDDRRDHRGFFSKVDRTGGHDAGCIHQISVTANARNRLLDAFKTADRHFELRAHMTVGATGQRTEFGHAGGVGRQRNRAPGGKAIHQHLPALSGIGRTTDDVVERNENIAPPVRAVHEHRVQGQMPATDMHSRCGGGNQRQRDTDIITCAEQMLRVIQTEGEPQQRRHRTEGDVALLPGESHAEHFGALPGAAADHAEVGNGTGVRSGLGAGQRKAWHLTAIGEPRQIMIFLRIAAVMQQQFGRPQRVGHHHRHRGGTAARREFHHDFRMGQRGEAFAAEHFRNDHAEKTLILDELPRHGRQIMQLVGDLPVIKHGAEFFHRAVDERAFLRRQRWFRISKQLVPVRVTAKEFAIPPHRTGVERLLLGL